MPMLRHTLILPEKDAALAARLLQEAIDDLSIIPMIVLGKGPRTEQVVRWADQLCARSETPDGECFRRVVWIRDPSPKAIQDVMKLWEDFNTDAKLMVLNFHQQVKVALSNLANVDPIALEAAFLKGSSL
jgi:hypothetical protein